MANSGLYAGALSLLIRHQFTGCSYSARQAADLLDRLAELPGLDDETRQLCDLMAHRLTNNGQTR